MSVGVGFPFGSHRQPLQQRASPCAGEGLRIRPRHIVFEDIVSKLLQNIHLDSLSGIFEQIGKAYFFEVGIGCSRFANP